MSSKRRIALISASVLLVVLVSAAWWYLRSLNSPLEVLNILNPRNAPSANVNPETPATLHAVQVKVPAEWSTGVFTTSRTLTLPEGLSVSVFASGFDKARMLAEHPDGTLFVTDSEAGTVLALPDTDKDGSADRRVEFARGLTTPHGIAFDGSDVYVADNTSVRRFRDTNNDYQSDEATILVSNLPKGGGHVTRTIVIGADDKLYVSVGSSCNVCKDDERRAAVLRFEKDGSNEQLFARGLRNSVGLTFRPGTQELWATDNGRDLLGDNIPPEEVNLLTEGGDYGWPYCYGDRIGDSSMNNVAHCPSTIAPRVAMQAHSAPLGLRFSPLEDPLPGFANMLFVAFHGSWNRREPTGYKVIGINVDEATSSVMDFATGWLVNGKAWGRPVDVLFAHDGVMYISDDSANVIYRIAEEVS